MNYAPPDPGRNRANTLDLLRIMDVRTLPREVATKIKIQSALNWADLEVPQIYHSYFYLFVVGPKNTKCPRMGLVIGLRG